MLSLHSTPHIPEQQRGWQPEHTLAVAEAIQEAMDSSPVKSRRSRPSVETPRDLPTPEPHLPLRKASAHSRLRSRKGQVPQPILAPSNEQKVRGFSPNPVPAPVPHIENITASSEHAFAAREDRRPFKSAVGTLENQAVLHYAESSRVAVAQEHSRPPSSPLLPSPATQEFSPRLQQKTSGLRSSKSVGEGMRSWRHRISGKKPDSNGQTTPDSLSARTNVTIASEQVRESFRSALTSNSSSMNTRHTSLSTSNSESFVQVQKEDYYEGGLTDVDMSVEDAIGMYEDGFESVAGSARGSLDIGSLRSANNGGKLTAEVRSVSSLHMDRPASQPHPQTMTPSQPTTPSKLQRPYAAHRRSQSASVLNFGVPKNSQFGASPGSGVRPSASRVEQRPSAQTGSNTSPEAVPRDRYGFKKATQYITVEQYDAWNAEYSDHVERRSKKWHALMHQYGLSTERAVRFPPKSDKIKRYVRKGIPPEFRGAAWFWYAGGPRLLARQDGLYQDLVEQAKPKHEMLSDNDREHIERDLNRTFPDNVRFKPDPTTTHDAQAGAGGGSVADNDKNTNSEIAERKKQSRRPTMEAEMPIVGSLRRVLQAFALHNPNIGYCQSLNFIAGLLLLFLDEDEEKTFVLLNIITSQHLPGTHGIALEGANIDIAVLMTCVRDTLPGVWSRLDDKGAGVGGSGISALRLPTVSLATTAWFMSLFVGTLPIEAVLRVWDCLFFEGSKTLFRIALSIFKAGEPQILQVSDPMEIFQVVQTIPRGMLDVNELMDTCFKRRGGFGGLSQDVVEGRRAEMRKKVQEGIGGGLEEGALRRLKGRLRRQTNARP